jgi:hypothetical protein
MSFSIFAEMRKICVFANIFANIFAKIVKIGLFLQKKFTEIVNNIFYTNPLQFHENPSGLWTNIGESFHEFA